MKSALLFFFLIFIGTFQLEGNSLMYNKIVTEDPITFSWDDLNVNIYPNPATNYFSISNLNSDIAKIEIFNMLGRKMGSFEINTGNHYVISDYPKGMYLVQFISSNQKILKTIRLNKR